MTPKKVNIKHKGFALVVTLSLMILLTIIAVGLLTLSSVSLRSAREGSAAAAAQANARFALMMALGELQKNAGPDQRITAGSDIMQSPTSSDAVALPNVTGVWQSWKFDPNSPPSESEFSRADGKNSKFLRWLISHPSEDQTKDQELPVNGIPPDQLVELMKNSDVGGVTIPPLVGGLVPIHNQSNQHTGGYAWAVMDEGVKARIDTPYESIDSNTTYPGDSGIALGSGVRADAARITGLEGFTWQNTVVGADGHNEIEKGISLGQAGLVNSIIFKGSAEAVEELNHHVTVNSLGLMTNVADGGLKEDMHALLASTSMPAKYKDQGLYSTLLNFGNAPAEPTWDSVLNYGRLYAADIRKLSGSPMVTAKTPGAWRAAKVDANTGKITSLTTTQPPGAVITPVIAKVQMAFSLLARDLYKYPGKQLQNDTAVPPKTNAAYPLLHGPWGENARPSDYNFMLHVLYTPVVTLYNPYNVNLRCSNLQVEFVNVPLSMIVYRNGVPQMTAMTPVTQMYYDTKSGTSKRFKMTLKEKTKSGSPGSTTFELQPGEVKVFSPYINPKTTWAAEKGSGSMTFDDYKNDKLTSEIEAIPGWFGEGIGYDIDWLAPETTRVTDVETYADKTGASKTFSRGGCIFLKNNDSIHLEFVPQSDPKSSDNKFQVTMSVNNKICSAIEFDYEKESGLTEFLLDGKPLRYPDDGSTIKATDMLDNGQEPIGNYANTKPFALFSAYAKTTKANADDTTDDGRLATKPWVFNHPVIPVSTQKVLSEHPAHHPYEIELQVLDQANGFDTLVQVNAATSRGNFITGHTSFNGRKLGGLYELPLAPVQSLVNLNGANLAGSAYLPHFAYPVGNSWAHPLLATSEISRSGSTGIYLDHSFLLNAALFDRFYFSGFSDYRGAFVNNRTPLEAATSFYQDGARLDDPRFVPYLPNGKTADEAPELVTDSSTGYRTAASYQLLKGAFNVNSTSKYAWKAMLASLMPEGGVAIKPGDTEVTIEALAPPISGNTRFSRFRTPLGDSAAISNDPERSNWLGPVDMDDQALDALATSIVSEVRKRGPFLSMAEFVNRQLGGTSDLTLKGALQAAIDASGINKAAEATSGYDIPSAKIADYEYVTPEAATGPSAQGAPGCVTQADLLGALGNAATVRSDTFRIRSYGEARDASGKVTAKAWCEAVVQRYPEFCDPTDSATTPPDDLNATNQKFGRRFEILSFRWLSPAEVL